MKFLTIFLFSFLVACGGSSTEEVENSTTEVTVQPVSVDTTPASNQTVGDVVVTTTSEPAQVVTACADGTVPVNGVCPPTATGQVESTPSH